MIHTPKLDQSKFESVCADEKVLIDWEIKKADKLFSLYVLDEDGDRDYIDEDDFFQEHGDELHSETAENWHVMIHQIGNMVIQNDYNQSYHVESDDFDVEKELKCYNQ